MAASAHMVVVRESKQVSPSVDALVGSDNGQVSTHYSCREALQRLSEVHPKIVIIDAPASTAPGGHEAFGRLIEAIDAQGIACILVADQSFDWRDNIPEWIQVLDYGVSTDELRGRILAVQHFQQLLRNAQLEMRYMQRLGRHLDRKFAEVDQDMRLASRLQREFLPRTLPSVPSLKFSVLYRPATWVSGDIYDISRVDEDHICVYVADAVGHGVAASLLTMFVKQSVFSKEVKSTGYRLLSPSETLSRLNEALTAEKLNNSQFVTAAYCMINHRTMTVEFARGGHPHPLLVDELGGIREIIAEGGLLGLFSGQDFPTKKIELKPGQKLIVHSDGMEQAFVEHRDFHTGTPRYQLEFQKQAHLPAEELTRRIERLIDAEEGSLNPRDDVTMLVVEALPT